MAVVILLLIVYSLHIQMCRRFNMSTDGPSDAKLLVELKTLYRPAAPVKIKLSPRVWSYTVILYVTISTSTLSLVTLRASWMCCVTQRMNWDLSTEQASCTSSTVAGAPVTNIQTGHWHSEHTDIASFVLLTQRKVRDNRARFSSGTLNCFLDGKQCRATHA